MFGFHFFPSLFLSFSLSLFLSFSLSLFLSFSLSLFLSFSLFLFSFSLSLTLSSRDLQGNKLLGPLSEDLCSFQVLNFRRQYSSTSLFLFFVFCFLFFVFVFCFLFFFFFLTKIKNNNHTLSYSTKIFTHTSSLSFPLFFFFLDGPVACPLISCCDPEGESQTLCEIDLPCYGYSPLSLPLLPSPSPPPAPPLSLFNQNILFFLILLHPFLALDQSIFDELTSLYNQTNGDLWTQNENWLTNVPDFGWSGLTDDKFVFFFSLFFFFFLFNVIIITTTTTIILILILVT